MAGLAAGDVGTGAAILPGEQGLIPRADEPRELFVPEVLEETVIEASRPRSAVS
jgi:hypothetical protein